MLRFAKLGKVYKDGERIVTQGDAGECMYVVQSGKVEIMLESSERNVTLTVLKPGEFFGEMSLFTKSPRSATAVARGKAQVLTIDKKGFLKRIHQDPSLVFLMLKKLSKHIQALNSEVMRLENALAEKEIGSATVSKP